MTLSHLDTSGARPLAKNKLRIRPAKREDMAQIAAFVRSSADWYRPFLAEKDLAEHDVDEAWEEKNFRLRNFYIGSVEGRPVGTISLQYFGLYAYLGYIYLDSEQVGKGYGQQLMRFAEFVARKVGMAGMVLIAHPKATWAKKAYLKYGFEIVETERERVLAWQNRTLEPYYEEGFELYQYIFEDVAPHLLPHA